MLGIGIVVGILGLGFFCLFFANLFDDEDGEGFSLIWSRSRRKNGE